MSAQHAVFNVLPMRRGRRPTESLPRVLTLYPPKGNGRTFIYAIAFNGGVVKVGSTTRPRKRLSDHVKRVGGDVAWVHLFTSMHDTTARRVERAMPETLAALASPVNGSEWFMGDTSKGAVVTAIRRSIDRIRAEVQDEFNKRREGQAKVAAAKKALERAGISGIDVSVGWYGFASGYEGKDA